MLQATFTKITDFGKSRTWLGLAIKATVVFVFFALMGWRRLDPDFGWHLQAGNYIAHHGIPSHDIFTYTARSFHWINHEWGSDVLLWLLFSLGGYWLLSLVYGALWTLALHIAAPKARLSVLLLATAALLPFAGIRPMVWTVLFLAFLLKLLTLKSGRAKLAIPILFIVWANLHGGFVIGLAVIAYHAIKSRQKIWWWVLMASLVATFVNPYGPVLYTEVFRTLTDRSLHNQIQEWWYFSIPSTAWLFLVSWAAGLWLFDRKHSRNWLGLAPLLLLASLSANRNVPLFVIAAVASLEIYVQKFRSLLPKNPTQGIRMAMVSFALVFWVVLALSFAVGFRGSGERETGYPKRAVNYLGSHGCPGNLFNSYNYGGYLIWKLPTQLVFIDGRMPSWRNANGEKYFDYYDKVLQNPQERAKAFQQYNIRCVLARSSGDRGLLDSLTQDGWQTTLEADDATLMIK